MRTYDTTSQEPQPGTRLLKFRGDTQTFTLWLHSAKPGSAWLRSNFGHAYTTRQEIINGVDANLPPLGGDWFDIPMKRIDDRTFQVTVPLCEVGHFEAKCFFLEQGSLQPIWPEGFNVSINVEPADTCCANIIYNAFVRQFGPNKSGTAKPGPDEQLSIQALDQKGYAVIPPSGTFRDVIGELDFIIGKLGCRILQLLPILPTPTTYARMGRFGSPYASLSFTAIDPALAQFDPRATPLEQFIELVDAVHARHAKIIIDIAINHTGWAAGLHEMHPEWLVRDPEGRIEVPGAWGVLWEDLTMLDYTQKALWKYMAEVFLVWCRRGVDGFRCDAGYMIPLAAWKYIVASVRNQYPDTLFFLEGLGGKISVTRDILNLCNFNWAYSELFQNYDRKQIESYLPEALDISCRDGLTVHFAETHDNNRLAARSPAYARMRTALCALCSSSGAFAFANGVEWFATEKIDVHDARSLNWGAEQNQVDFIQRLTILLKNHPAFHSDSELTLVQGGRGNHIALLRHHIPTGKRLLILVNLDDEKSVEGSWHAEQTGMTGPRFIDLLSEKEVAIHEVDSRTVCPLGPAEVLCLTEDPEDRLSFTLQKPPSAKIPLRIRHQRLRAKAMEVFRTYKGTCGIDNFDPDQAAVELERDPVEFCRRLNPYSLESRVTVWQWPRDSKRTVMIPPEHFLLLYAESPFRARIMNADRCVAQEESLFSSEGRAFALFTPLQMPASKGEFLLQLSVFGSARCQHADGLLMFLSRPFSASVQKVYHRTEALRRPLLHLSTNRRGAVCRASVLWGNLYSKYDALLAGNPNPDFPDERRIVFTRCRAWLVYQGYSQEICSDCFDAFCYGPGSQANWRFQVPSGNGEHTTLFVSVDMAQAENAVRIRFFRKRAKDIGGHLPDAQPVRLILRPDIEDRHFHETTKAYLGPEHDWPRSFEAGGSGFSFFPHPERKYMFDISRGTFVSEPEWYYMVHRVLEEERGLDPYSDLFSPGYFFVDLKGNDMVELTACMLSEKDFEAATWPDGTRSPSSFFDAACDRDLIEALKDAIEHYVVDREKLKSVIAGYPWFLDWGRDSLIFTRGLIAAGKLSAARAILTLFGGFEKRGTIPNMIRGDDTQNRDTADAPLWFCVACADLLDAEGSREFLHVPCSGRSVSRILSSIATHMIEGTPNGIKMDPESGLIFSPAHFTWMDTNYPAGTPREGYPIEIQSLWFFTLSFLARIDSAEKKKKWMALAHRVRQSISHLFWLEEEGYLADCLHAEFGEPAHKGVPDDALRPNQLFAITLGAVTDPVILRGIVSSCEELLVPGALRSLAARPVKHPLKILLNSNLLNDPLHPYQGRYAGDEDTRRKPAYHNGTAWTWLLPTFCEAWVRVFGPSGKETALALLLSGLDLMNQGCVGHLPEILDGDAPHTPRGCDAQAWSVSELLRVLLQLDDRSKK